MSIVDEMATKTFQSAEAKQRFGAVIDHALSGGRVDVTRNGKPCVSVVSTTILDKLLEYEDAGLGLGNADDGVLR